MKRKQIYIAPDQDRSLRALARRRGQTESELIREGIDKVLVAPRPPRLDSDGWSEALAFIDHLISQGPVKGKRTWTREEIYDERIRRGR
jgi:hypothetical protein